MKLRVPSSENHIYLSIDSRLDQPAEDLVPVISSTRLRDFADKVRATYWYVPALMTLVAAISALVLLWVNQALPNKCCRPVVHPPY